MAREMKLTHQTLTELLDYDPATGAFVWKVARSNRVKIGAQAGVLHAPSGGRYISLGDEKFMAHRLAWFYVHGAMPANDVRPLDGNYDNCAIANLAEMTRVELAHKREKTSTNTSGFNGVSRGRGDFWQAKITWNYKQINLGGSFETAELAGAAVEAAYEALKETKTTDDVDEVILTVRSNVRLRAAWNNIVRSFPEHQWNSFEHFSVCCADIEFPTRRYAMVPVDASRPIGPDNFKWALPANAEHNTVTGRLAYRQARDASHKDHYRDRDFRKKYGISFADYSFMLEAQSGVCAICEKPEIKLQHGKVRLLSVDHDHKTGAVRGLLCGNCNMAIGYACDDVSRLEKAIKYLRDREPKNASGDAAKIMN